MGQQSFRGTPIMQSYVIIQFLLLLLVKVEKSDEISSPIEPFTTYKNSAELERNVADLWWTVDDAEREIMFELHVKTTGWIALGISPAGGMSGADIGVGWVDRAGKVHFQDRHAFSTSRPVIDNTTTDWFHLQGREQNGWTSIQFKRLLDTCDSMDVPIRSGTNVLIFAYGLVDPDMSRSDGDISYHDSRRGSRMIPLRSYGSPSSEEKFVGLDSFEFRASNYHVPSDESTYYCKVYKAPNHFQIKRHAIANHVLIDSANRDLIHHMVVYECDPAATFDDANLPDDACDNVYVQVPLCMSNSASVWAIGGDYIEEFPEEAGYPVGGNFPVKYYVLEIHYDNPKRALNRTDNSGIRFYMGKELRQHDIGFLSFGTGPNPASLAIPPQVNRFIVDSYCDPKASQGDAFATRCVYNTMNKKEITLGGLRTKDEMCLHIFSYYPRMNNYYSCFTRNDMLAWQTILNTSSPIIDNRALSQLLLDMKWTPALAVKWQEFYNNASRVNYFGSAGHFEEELFSTLPKYEDLKSLECRKKQ
ncbi:unnamed protein product [Rotaria socialis]|uniref:DOMON domain-containing protein n=1 Tax=Rotaria socialis TaxID=392032 RepID=A0A821JV13_9BILA|nr:unnamed protein product [Rotaria socialis]CAF4725127.1 unnamed protein product [Rotaria socialis]